MAIVLVLHCPGINEIKQKRIVDEALCHPLTRMPGNENLKTEARALNMAAYLALTACGPLNCCLRPSP
jgi:hypothetical protein